MIARPDNPNIVSGAVSCSEAISWPAHFQLSGLDMQLSETGRTIDDFDLRRRIVNFLYSRQLTGISRLRIETSGERVTVRGSFASKRARELCLELIRHVKGVFTVDDKSELMISKLDVPEVKAPRVIVSH